MAGHGHSSASTEPPWVNLGDGVFAAGNITSSTWTKDFELTNRPTWEDLLEYGRCFYKFIDARWADNFPTERTGSCLVATLCVATQIGEYTVFHSTIPRGAWRKYMSDNGSIEAPLWYAAAHSQPLKGSRNVEIHAEDGVEFLANRKFPRFNNPVIEEPRLIVYGHKGDEVIQQIDLCKKPPKNPDCQRVATLLGIIFPNDKVSADQMDINEARGRRPAATLHITTEEELRNRTGNSERGGSSSTQHYTGGNNGHQGSSRPQAPRLNSGSRHNDLSSLTKGMSALRVGGGGGGSISHDTSQSSRAPPGLQLRPSTTSGGRPPTTSGGRPSTGASAPRISVAPPVPASRNSTGHRG
ncbi:hypothetical protein C8A00DRAFT_31006 [Chaetomidium leptoderma]|uniref:Uncharacterized protein n=1 Tax=Chaetomidium leptoderma TaxID=669021 RepID=A0AAN6VQZ9_9PEZI|nr:hypothetical protein C8A00DRAFT_31006 [Chaetomidium leptoderma]